MPFFAHFSETLQSLLCYYNNWSNGHSATLVVVCDVGAGIPLQRLSAEATLSPWLCDLDGTVVSNEEPFRTHSVSISFVKFLILYNPSIGKQASKDTAMTQKLTYY